VRRLAFLLLAVCLCLSQQSSAFWQSRDSNYNTNVVAGGGGGGCSQATAFLARTSGLDSTHTTAYTTLICGLVTDGVWARLDILYVFATQDSTTALLNLTSTTYSATAVSSPTFTADQGYLGNGTTSYVDLGFKASTAASPKYVQDDAVIFAWMNNNISGYVQSIGEIVTSVSYITLSNADALYYIINGGGQARAAAIGTTAGFASIERSSSTATATYWNGSSLSTASLTSSAVPTQDFIVLGSAASFYALQASAAGGGKSLGSTLQTALYSRLATYRTAVGL
jgi:hypothetical protein